MTTERHIPRFAGAVLTSLCFSSPNGRATVQLNDQEWENALAFSDRAGLTLPLSQSLKESTPDWVRERLSRNLSATTIRWTRLQQAYLEICRVFESAHVEFLVLKGFSQCPDFVGHPRLRVQNDIDLLLPARHLYLAHDIVSRLAYEVLGPDKKARIDHLPTMIRKTGWQWRGDYFDPDIPISLDLHFRLWDEATEGFRLEGLDSFWDRRVDRELDGLSFTSLARPDTLAYACLHALRHLLRGDSRPSNIYEIASFLERSQSDDEFWNSWEATHDKSVRRTEAVCFALATAWFGCGTHPIAREEQNRLSVNIRRWLDVFSHSPLAARFRPNKDELWLHMSMLDSAQTKIAVLRRRLIPSCMPGPVDAVHLPDSQRTLLIEIRCRFRYFMYAGKRAAYHLRVLMPALLGGVRWSLGRVKANESSRPVCASGTLQYSRTKRPS